MRATPGVCLGIGAAGLSTAVALLPMPSWRKAVADAYHGLLPRSLGCRYVSVIKHLRGDQAVCWWSTMPVISIPWYWSQCYELDRFVAKRSWLTSSLDARFRRLGTELSNARPTARRRKHTIGCCKPSSKGSIDALSQRAPSACTWARPFRM